MEKVLILLSNRIIKLFANTTKMLCYIFHYFFPRKRFLLPKKAPAFFRAKHGKKIPKIIWQTNYTDRVTLPVYLNYLFNRLLSPSYEYRFMVDGDRLEFIQKHASERVCQSYARLNVGAAQADLWRLLVLQHYGGVYMDIDAHLVWPLSFIIEDAFEELYLLRRKDHYTNYFIASQKNKPKLEEMIAMIVENIEAGDVESVYSLTGPVVQNRVLTGQKVESRFYRYTCVQGDFTNEYFQYMDKPGKKWNHISAEDVLSKD